jgi:hypothetical protein
MAEISPLRRRMIEDMTVRNLSPATQQSYLSAVLKFSRYFGRSPDRLGLEDVHAFQVHLVATGVSWPALNQIVCALRFFYGVTLGQATVPERIALFRLNRGDGGFYIDKACIVSRDPDDFENDEVQNVGMYRLEVKGPNRIGIQPVPEHDVAVHLAHAEERSEDLPIYITLGASPLMAEASFPGNRRRQRDVYARARRRHLDEASHRGLCPHGWHAVHDHSAWAWLRQDRDRGG